MSKRLVVVLAVVWMVLLVAGSASSITLALCGVSIGNPGNAENDEQVIVTQQQYQTIERYAQLQEILEIVQSSYYEEVDEETLLTGAKRGMLDVLEDPYTFYYTPEEMSASNEHSAGKYVGVGLQVMSGAEGNLVVTRAFRDSSAQLAGIRGGDIIRLVDGIAVNALTTQAMNDAVALIKGEAGSTVQVTVERDGMLLDFELERGSILINRVEYTMLEDGIGYIMLYEFMGDDVDGFTEALDSLMQNGARGLIVDVRSNTGGLLDDVVKIADLLLPEGLVVYIENRAGERESFYSDADACPLPMAVLVNGMSASASEILAGAIQDSGVGVIVGETTFGKGIVQTVIPFRDDGSGIQLTTSRYYTPSGRTIHECGITPDIVVEGADYDFTISPQPDPEQDAQLAAAIDAVKEAIGE